MSQPYPERPESNWVNYLTLLDDRPTMISVDAGWIDMLGYRDTETLLGIEVPLRQTGEDEIVSRQELPALQDLATAIEAELPEDFAFLTARSYGSGKMVLYIYTVAPDEVMELLEPLFDEADYSPRSFELQDPDWAFYTERLFPDDIVWQNISNDQLLSQLAEHGDDGRRPRPITHRAQFPDRDAAGEFASQISEMDHEILSFDETETGELIVSVDFTREDAPADINEVTGPLVRLAVRAGGQYDGWSTAVLVNPAPADEDEDEDERD